MSDRKLWTEGFKAGAVPVLSAAGFSGKATLFNRRLGSTIQVLSFRGDSRLPGERLLELGIDLDEIRSLLPARTSGPVVGKTLVWLAPSMEQLGLKIRDRWVIGAPSLLTAPAIAEALQKSLTSLIAVLDRIDGPRAVLEHVELSRGSDPLQRAQLKYLLGDDTGAFADVQSICTARGEGTKAMARTLEQLGLQRLLTRGS
jgi:hypothetical protein